MCRKKSGVAVKSGDDVVVYTIPGNDSHSDIREKHNLRDDASLMARYQTPVEFVPVRGLFDIADYEFAFDESQPEWWTDKMTESAKKQLFRAAMDEWDGKTLKSDKDIDLSSLTSISEGVTLKAGGSIYLSSLTSISEGVTLEAGWYINLNSLTSISEGVTLKAGWGINLSSLTSIPEGVTLKAGGDINLSSLTSISEGVTLEAGGGIYAIGKWWNDADALRKAMKG